MYKAVIVDDETLSRIGLRSMLDWEKEGFEIIGEAASGKDGLKLVLDTDPDLVISDIVMPGMNGLEMYEEIREEGECFSLKDLAVNGQDLMAAGARPGPALGEALRYLLDLVIEDPSLNQKEILLGKFREWALQDNGSVL